MQTTIATPGVYRRGLVIPQLKPKAPPQQVVVVYIGTETRGEEKKKRRVRKAINGGERLSASARAVIDARLAEGLRDIKEGREFGPFSNAQDMIRALEE